MDETLFFVLGIGLVLLALAVSAIGLRSEGFPANRGLLVLTLGIVIAVVAGTATFAWLNAADEQTKRNEERASGELPTPAEVVQAEASGETPQQEEHAANQGGAPSGGGGGGTTTTTTGGAASTAEGAKLFEAEGCSSCHTLQAANATGTVGPNLDTALANKSVSFVKTSIIDPNAVIAKGYQPNIMPGNFGDTLSDDQINAIAQYLIQSTK
jgi:mono/diheme cytochrome c family protein